MAQLVYRFLQHFALPLVAGGRLHVGRPIDADELQVMQKDERWTDLKRQVEAHRERRAKALWHAAVDVTFGQADVQLALGIYNLLARAHPAMQLWTRSAHKLRRLESFTRRCLSAGTPAEELELVARHTLLAKVHTLRRTDVDLRYWVGHRRFIGQEPPARLLRWRRLRGVVDVRREVYWLGEVGEPVSQSLVRLLFEQSPLTALLAVPRPYPPVEWERLAPYLRSPRIARLVCHEYLRKGLDRVGPSLAQSFWSLVERASSPTYSALGGTRREARRALHMVVGLVEYLYTALALGERLVAPLPAGPSANALTGVLIAGWRCGLGRAGRRQGAEPADALDVLAAGTGGLGLDARVEARVSEFRRAAEAAMGSRMEPLIDELRQALRP